MPCWDLPELFINHFEKNDDTAEEIPYYLKRFLIKQFLNNCSTTVAASSEAEEFQSMQSVEEGFIFYR